LVAYWDYLLQTDHAKHVKKIDIFDYLHLTMEIKEINTRYSELAESDCCLSCGGAINYAEPKIGEVCVDLGSGRGTDVLRMAESVGKSPP
jgi:hypothetical protein